MANYNLFDAASLVMIPTGTKDGKLYSIKPEPVYGSEKIINSSFTSDTAWSKGDGWSIGGGLASCDGTQTSNSNLFQDNSFEAGKTYDLSFTISNYQSGTITLFFGNTVGPSSSNDGVFVQQVVYTSGAYLFLLADASFVGSVDDVSVKEVVTADGDFTFTRGSNLTATRVDAAGLIEKGRENVLLQSNQFDTTWTKSASITSTSGQSDRDGGTDAWLLKRTDAGSRFIQQTVSVSGVNTFSFYAKPESKDWVYWNSSSANASGYINVANGTIGANVGSLVLGQKATSVGNGYYRVEVVIDATITYLRLYPAVNDGVIVGGVTDAGIFIQDSQLEQGLVATAVIETTTTTGTAGILSDLPRLNYSGGSACPSLLLEPSRQNNVLYSESLTTTWWLKSNVTTLDNQGISPEGLNNAGKITLTSTGAAVIYKTSLTIGDGVLSFFAKPGTLSAGRIRISVDGVGAADWNLDGTINSVSGGTAQTAENYGNGWFRYSYNVPSGSVANYGVQGGVIGESMLMYGMQVEPNATFQTSYIPTYGSSATRTAEFCIDAGDVNTFNSTQGVLYAEMSALADDVTETGLEISLSGTTGNSVRILYSPNTSLNSLFARIDVGGVRVVTFNYTGVTITNVNKFALRWAVNDFSLWINGVKVLTDTNGVTFPSNTLSKLNLSNVTGTIDNLEGNVKQLLTFNTALTDTELATLTTL